MKRNIKIIAIIVLSALLLNACSALGLQSTPTSAPIPTVQGSGKVISEGNLVPKDFMYLSFPTAGHVTEILVQQGDHVTAGQVTAEDVVKLSSAKTLEGGSRAIHAGDGGVMVNNAHVTRADIAASNGVIHAIDTVLLPPE